MVEAAIRAEAASPELIDINFGCPVKKIAGARGRFGYDAQRSAHGRDYRGRSKGGETSRYRQDAARMGRPEQEHRGDSLTFAGRRYRGSDDTRTHPGADVQGEADWTLIGAVKNNPQIRIPIIGNGDIDTPQKAREAFDRYGVDAIMVGRATYGRPWIFRQIRHYLDTGELLPQPSVIERVALAKHHLERSIAFKGPRVGIFEMRRHLSSYFKGLPSFKETRLRLVTTDDPDELYALLDEIAERWGDVDFSGQVPDNILAR